MLWLFCFVISLRKNICLLSILPNKTPPKTYTDKCEVFGMLFVFNLCCYVSLLAIFIQQELISAIYRVGPTSVMA